MAHERAARAAADGLSPSAPLLAAPHASRLEVRVNDGGDLATLTFDLGARPELVLARGVADRVAGPRVRVCR